MSILNVEHLTHGFGDRAIFNDVSFRLLKGEHIGLVGANGEGKSTFFNIVTGKLMPDEGKIEWAKNVRVGYLDQHSVLSQGMSIRDVLKSAFSYLFEMEERMNGICDSLGTASPEEMDTLMEELGTIQDTLTMHDFYVIDAKVEEVARALGLLDIGLERDVTDLSGGQRTKVLLGKLLLEKPDILLLDEPTNYLDVQHIEWLKRYLQEYENAFILISHDIPFLNSVVNLIYHMDNQQLNRYVGDYDKHARFGDRISITGEVSGGKWITPVLGTRVQISGLHSAGKDAKGNTESWNFMLYHIDALVNVMNWWCDVNEARTYSAIPLIGVGIANAPGKKVTTAAFTVGLLNRFKVSEHLDINIEIKGNLVGDRLDGCATGKNGEGAATLTAGFAYNF